MWKKPPTTTTKLKFDYALYRKLDKRIVQFTVLNQAKVKKQKNFFTWIFHIIHRPRFSVLNLKKRFLAHKQFLRFERRTAPDLNLRLHSLVVGIMRHGKANLARTIVSKVIILLTETCEERSGCLILDRVLAFLEPSVGFLRYRRGRNFFGMPVPLWPCRKKFLAAKFLLDGTRRRQQLHRYSFMLALYYEILDVYYKKKDSFTLKIYKRYCKKLQKVEDQVWRSKKKKY